MTSVGFEKSIVDRQLFYKQNSEGELLIATDIHADDLLSLILHDAAFRKFHHEWTKRFGGKPLGEIQEFPFNYVGACYSRDADGNILVSAGHLLHDLGNRLVELLACPEAMNLPRLLHDVPMAADALLKL